MSDERWPDEEEHKQGDEITPYEPFWVRWHKPLTDEEFVERTRKGAASTKRLMPYLLVFNGCVVCFVLFLGRWTTDYRPWPSTSQAIHYPKGILTAHRVGIGTVSSPLLAGS